MTIMMPASDQAVLGRRDAIVAALRAIVPGEGVIDSPAEMLPYESDGLMAYRQPPMVVVLPDTTEQVARVLKYCYEQGIKVVPRGSGTSLSGGALPLADGVLLGLGKFKRIREIDFDNRVVVTEPGVTNLAISQAVAHAGFYYAPDPSSQIACSIGGNVAENSGGVHCLKYGMTTNNVLGCEIVLITGEIIRIGGKSPEAGGYDLMGIITGSEGLLGVITEITVRILQKPETARALMVGFAQVEAAGECVARDHRRRHHPGRHGDDGQARDPRRRGLRPCRLSARRRGAVDHRTRRSRRRSRRTDRARRGDRARLRLDDAARSPRPSRSATCSGPAARRRFPRWGGFRPIICAWTAPSRAPRCRRRWRGFASSRKNTALASPMCFTPATAICIR